MNVIIRVGRVIASTGALVVLLAGCPSPLPELNNPYDPESEDSPLGTTPATKDAGISPDDQSGLVTVDASWDAIPEAERYHVQIADRESFDEAFIRFEDDQLTDTSAQWNGAADEVQYWIRLRYFALVEYRDEPTVEPSPWIDIGTVGPVSGPSPDDGADADDGAGDGATDPDGPDNLVLNETFDGQFDQRGEIDSYLLPTVPGTRYALEVEDEWSGLENGADPIIEIRDTDTDGFVLAPRNKSGDKVSSPIQFTATSDTTWISLESDNPDTTFYTITVRRIDTESGTFISTWVTSNPGASADNQVTLPLVDSGIYDFTVQWGDGETDQITGSDVPAITHTYPSPGEYTIEIDGVLVGWSFSGGRGGDQEKIVDVQAWGPMAFGPTSFQFNGARNLRITATDAPDLSLTRSLDHAFEGASSLQAPDLSAWDTSQITSMAATFNVATNFNGDVSTWNTSNVESMSLMFGSANRFNQPIGGWDTSSVTDMGGMFTGVTAFNQDISGWDVFSVEAFELEIYGFLDSAALSPSNYDAILTNWESGPVRSGLTVDFGDSQYSAGAPVEARQRLIDNAGWTISDAGLVELVPAELISEFTMDNISGDTLLDETGVNNGTITGAVGGSGIVGDALVFRGSDKVTSQNPTIPSGDEPRSVSAWIRTEPGQAFTSNIVSWGDGQTQNARWSVMVTSAGDGSAAQINIIGESNDIAIDNAVPEDQWTHVAVTYDRSNLSVYVDGENVLVAPPSEPYETDGAFPLMIGTNTENRDDEYFIGSIDQVRIYDGTLTQSEILDLFNGGNGQ